MLSLDLKMQNRKRDRHPFLSLPRVSELGLRAVGEERSFEKLKFVHVFACVTGV